MSHSKLLDTDYLSTEISSELCDEYILKFNKNSFLIESGKHYVTFHSTRYSKYSTFLVQLGERYLEKSQGLSYTGFTAMFRAI